MKIRYKKTGEVHEITEVVPLHDMDKKFVIYSKTEGHNHAYKNLAELNAEWEDYEEPKESKEHYFIAEYGRVYPVSAYEDYNVVNFDDYKEIGNYFGSREEAEKAVEKLKAWKRLKAQGFRFTNWVFSDVLDGNLELTAKLNFDNTSNIQRDLEVCFGGDE